ncbi:pectate lyase [Xanthomonas cassavae]|uniref:pectate lyase n=1 Tax=Xanthomonas cassavae TaxID=56450 RepID=UPI0004085BDD|nr:pectate lyase [Xanthomonas cassavae]
MIKFSTFAFTGALLLAPLSAMADKIADNMLLLQTASGGWSKQYKGVAVDYTRTFTAAEIAELQQPGRKDDATIDNKATTYEITYLATAFKNEKNAKYIAAARLPAHRAIRQRRLAAVLPGPVVLPSPDHL